MTEVVATIDAEIVYQPEPLSEGGARQLDKRIKLACVRVNDERGNLLDLLEAAAAGMIHIALGKTWGQWWKESVVISPVDLSERKALMRLMSGKGCSQREIAELAGVNQSTVSRALAELPPDADASPVTIGLDDKTYKREKPAKQKEEPEEEPEPPRTVTDVINDFGENMDYLMPAVQAFNDQLKDDAELFPKARKKIAKSHQNSLQGMIADLQHVVDELMS